MGMWASASGLSAVNVGDIWKSYLSRWLLQCALFQSRWLGWFLPPSVDAPGEQGQEGLSQHRHLAPVQLFCVQLSARSFPLFQPQVSPCE